MWWKAPTTVEPGSSAAACSAALPSATGSGYAPRSSNPIGLTQSITIFPASGAASDASRARWPSQGTATITTSASCAASAFVMPRTGTLGPNRVAASAQEDAAMVARSVLRDPMMTGLPAAANRAARPRPWSPVPPKIPITKVATSIPDGSCWSDMPSILPERAGAVTAWGCERRAGRRAADAYAADGLAGAGAHTGPLGPAAGRAQAPERGPGPPGRNQAGRVAAGREPTGGTGPAARAGQRRPQERGHDLRARPRRPPARGDGSRGAGGGADRAAELRRGT